MSYRFIEPRAADLYSLPVVRGVDVPHHAANASVRMLWRAVSALCAKGFHLPPLMAADLIHDFAGFELAALADFEAGANLRAEFDVKRFVEYVVVRVGLLNAQYLRLQDLRATVLSQSSNLLPEADSCRAHDLLRVRESFERLTENERELLLFFVHHGVGGLRTLAHKRCLPRQQLTGELSEAFGRFGRWTIEAEKSVDISVAVGYQLWCEGRDAASTARHLQLSRGDVKAAKLKFGALLACTFSESVSTNKRRESLMRTDDRSAIRAALLRSDEVALQFLRTNAGRIRSYLEHGDGDFLSADLVRATAEHPDSWAPIYEALWGSQSFAENRDQQPDEISRAIDALERDSERELGEAFNVLVATLPSDLTDWSRHFPNVLVDDSYIEHLRSFASVQIGGAKAVELTRYGMAPETFSAAARSLALMHGERLDDEQQFTRLGEVYLKLGQDAQLFDKQTVVANIAINSLLPQESDMPLYFTDWLMKVVELTPDFVPAYRVKVTHPQNNLIVAAKEYASLRSPRPDLRACWGGGGRSTPSFRPSF